MRGSTHQISLEVEGSRVALNSHRLGTGPLALFVHGWNHAGAVWHPVMEELKTSFELLAIDLPGCGRSPPLPAAKATIAMYARVIQSLVAHVTATRRLAALIGDSLGAVLVLSSPDPAPAECLLVSGCPAMGLPHPLRALGAPGLISSSLQLLRVAPKALSASVCRLLALGTVHRLKDVHPTQIAAILSSDPVTAERLFRELVRFRGISPARLPMRTRGVVLRGAHDRVVSRAASQELASALGASFIEIEGVGHTPMLEAPSRYAAILHDLLSGKESQ